MNPNSYSWCLIRCAIVKFTIHNITTFVTLLGIDSQGNFYSLLCMLGYIIYNKKIFIKYSNLKELAILSPLVHQTIKTLEYWSDLLILQLNSFNGPPDNYIIGCSLTTNLNHNGPKILKYQSMLDPANTPFV